MNHTPASNSSAPSGGTASGTAALELLGVTKRFGPVVACSDVSLLVRAGEIHGLLGENGAGKSTLMKVLTGLFPPDSGEIRLSGQRVIVRSPHEAARLGIAMVHQHFSLIPQLMVWENFLLGERGSVNPGDARRRISSIGERYGLDVDPNAFVGDLTAGQRQRVEIVKCFRSDPRVIVLDEPTSVLTQAESIVLFDVLRRVVAEQQRAVVLISHKLDEIERATDVVTVMRRGEVVHHGATKDTDPAGLARHMVGRPVALGGERLALGATETVDRIGGNVERPRSVRGPGELALDLRKITVGAPNRAQPLLDELSLTVTAGSILGLAGVEGNGQLQLGSVLAGTQTIDSGSVFVNGTRVDLRRPGALARSGVAIITEDRHHDGCALDLSVEQNLNVFNLGEVSVRGVLDPAATRLRAERLIEEFSIICPSPDTPMGALSGGNQQRVVLARELSRNPKILVAAQPTRGLDVGAVEFMLDQLRQAADCGMAVLLISTELEEVLGLSDRVAVISRGRIVGEMARDEVELDEIAMLLGGSQRSSS